MLAKLAPKINKLIQEKSVAMKLIMLLVNQLYGFFRFS